MIGLVASAYFTRRQVTTVYM